MNKQGKSVTKAAQEVPLKRDDLVNAIRQAIMMGDLSPGQRLVVDELCTLLNTTPGKVRAALSDLEHEGLVEHIANRGARVRIVELDEALHIAEIRELIETLCVRRAAENVTEGDAAILTDLAGQLKEKVANQDVLGYSEISDRIFRIYVHMARQPVAEEFLERLRDRNTRYRSRLTFRPGRMNLSLPYWLDLVDAICRRDPDRACDAVRRHSLDVQNVMREASRSQSNLPVSRGVA